MVVIQGCTDQVLFDSIDMTRYVNRLVESRKVELKLKHASTQ